MLSDMEMDGRSYQRCFKIPFQRGKDGRREGRRHDGRSWVWFPMGSFLWALFMCLHRGFFLVPSAQRCATLDETAVGVNVTGVCLKVSEVEASLQLLENGCMAGELSQWSQLGEAITSCDVQLEHFWRWNMEKLSLRRAEQLRRQRAREDAVERKWRQIAPSIQMAAGPFLLVR